ncbi:hypothetical protein [Roseivirga sp.]|uniref:hypothetical protein n=1 Tax=Roseivirga sp. TaxID=1964215 RepID=UPI003B524E1A
MRSYKYIILTIVLFPSTLLGQQLDFREVAFEQYVENSEEFKSILRDSKSNDFMISTCILKYEELASFMKKALDEVDMSMNLPMNKRGEFHTTKGKKRSLNKVYFSEIDNGLFMCEIFHDLTKRDNRKGSYIQGDSYIFLFRITKNRELEHIKTARFINN